MILKIYFPIRNEIGCIENEATLIVMTKMLSNNRFQGTIKLFDAETERGPTYSSRRVLPYTPKAWAFCEKHNQQQRKVLEEYKHLQKETKKLRLEQTHEQESFL